MVSKVLLSSRASTARASAEHVAHVRQAFQQTMGRLVENQRARLFLYRLEAAASSAALAGRKPSKMNRSDGNPAADSAAISAQEPGTGTTDTQRLAWRQVEAGIEISGVPASEISDVLPTLQPEMKRPPK